MFSSQSSTTFNANMRVYCINSKGLSKAPYNKEVAQDRTKTRRTYSLQEPR